MSLTVSLAIAASRETIRKLRKTQYAHNLKEYSWAQLQIYHIDRLGTQLRTVENAADKIKALQDYTDNKLTSVSVSAAAKLGETYELGIGVPANRVEAMKWFSMAAVKGANHALMLKLGEMHAVDGNDLESNRWIANAAATAAELQRQNVHIVSAWKELHQGFKEAASELIVRLPLTDQSKHDLIGTVFQESPHIAMMRRSPQDTTPEDAARFLWLVSSATERLSPPSVEPVNSNIIVSRTLLDLANTDLNKLADDCDGKVLKIELNQVMPPHIAFNLASMMKQRPNMIVVVVAQDIKQVEGSLQYEGAPGGLPLTLIGFDKQMPPPLALPILPANDPFAAMKPLAPTESAVFNMFEGLALNMGVTFLATRQEILKQVKDVGEAYKEYAQKPLNAGHLLADTLLVAAHRGRHIRVAREDIQGAFDHMMGADNHFTPK